MDWRIFWSACHRQVVLILLSFTSVFCSQASFAIDIPFLSSKIPYTIELNDHSDLKEKLKDDLDQQRDENLTLNSYKDPRKIARLEQDIIERSLKSQGYYSGVISAELIRATDAEESKPSVNSTSISDDSASAASKVQSFRYFVDPGPQFKIGEVHFDFPDGVDIDSLHQQSLAPGSPFIAADVLRNVETIKQKILNEYCFFSVDVRYKAYIVPSEAQAGVTFSMNSSPQVKFGTLSISGLESINEDYLLRRMDFKEGDCFKRKQVDKAKVALLRTNLLASVTEDLHQTEDGRVDVQFEVQERFHRTVKAGVGYSTDEGPNISLGWEHRNILGAAQKVDVSSRFSEVRQNLSSEFEVPAFVTPQNRLVMEASASHENLDSYDARTVTTGMRIEHELTPTLVATAGTRFKYSLINDTGDTENFGLLSFPFQLRWDTTDDILNPGKGWTLLGKVTPYVDLWNPDISFLNTSVSGSIYFTFDSLFWTPTLALRGAAGSISGEATRTIPADERFYVGGGGSVRGYPYQTLSEIEDDDPVGGNSFQEVSVETRFLIGESWGIVTFLDGGYAFEEATQEVDQELLWGAGFGFRYYTLFAPIRFDVGFPLNKREDIDDDFQLYVSIGQAF